MPESYWFAWQDEGTGRWVPSLMLAYADGGFYSIDALAFDTRKNCEEFIRIYVLGLDLVVVEDDM